MPCKFNGLADVHHGAELRLDELNIPAEPAYPTPIERVQAGALRGRRGSYGDQRGPGEAGGVCDGVGGFVFADDGDFIVSG